MLTHLHVKNLAVVEEAEVDFEKGLNILTGETGVGKSVIIGSINAVLGGKVNSEAIRSEADYAMIEAVFFVEPDKEKELKELGISPEDGQVIISRKIMTGRSICKINDETVTLALLKKVAAKLIDMYGQHEHQSLLDTDNHAVILDDFCKDEAWPVKEEVARIYNEYISVKKEFDKANMDKEERNREISFLEYEINEIEEAAIMEGEEEELHAQYKKLKNSENILAAVNNAYSYTSAGNDNALSLISNALGELNQVSGDDEDVDEYIKTLVDAETILSDVNHEMSSYISRYSFDEELFDKTSKRLDFIRKMFVKYGGSYESLTENFEKIKERYDFLNDFEKNIMQLEGRLSEIRDRLEQATCQLTDIRTQAAKQFEQLVKDGLADLNFMDVQYEVVISQSDNYSAKGRDIIEFMISTNPGEPVKSLAKVASGGELSRIMLAIKEVTAKKDSIPTLVFDEIDTGISGRTAGKVSEKLARIAFDKQVLCITHLAQIASMADTHFVIEKELKDNRTSTTIHKLDKDGEVNELARIIGGMSITDNVMTSAVEMKKIADSWKHQ